MEDNTVTRLRNAADILIKFIDEMIDVSNRFKVAIRAGTPEMVESEYKDMFDKVNSYTDAYSKVFHSIEDEIGSLACICLCNIQGILENNKLEFCLRVSAQVQISLFISSMKRILKLKTERYEFQKSASRAKRENVSLASNHKSNNSNWLGLQHS